MKKDLYRDLNLNILRCITYINLKNIIYIGVTQKLFVFLACLFSNYKIFPIDPKTKSNIINLKKNLNLII